MDLTALGWTAFHESSFQEHKLAGLVPARVALERRGGYLVWCEHGELEAELAGRFRHLAVSRSDYPAVGDWVALDARPQEGKGTIHALLPRRSHFSRTENDATKEVFRESPGGQLSRKQTGAATEEQVLASNVDTVFLVSGLDGDFNLRRIERYVMLARDSGAEPVILLNKVDLCTEVEARITEVDRIAPDLPIHAISAVTKQGLDVLQRYLVPGHTVALLGSSGVGKSTLVNALLGTERQEVRTVREDDSRGRHTTACRELILLPSGAILVDTPGMRAVQVWTDEDGLTSAFEDVEVLAGRCRFRDCGHSSEPGCAVRAALTDGTLDPGRYGNYLKMKRELRHLAARQSHKARLAEKAKMKTISKWASNINKRRQRGEI